MTSSAASGGHRDDERPRLGELLVALGALSQEQLLAALARQRELGVPLGRLLVEEGWVHPGAVAMALADQHGGLLKTEYGFATGHESPPPVRRIDPGETPEAPPAPLRLAAPPDQSGELAALRAELAAKTHQHAALEAELAAAREALAAERAARTETEAALQAALAEPERYPRDEHALFVRTPAGYRLATSVGPPPAVGETVEHGDRSYEVVHVGPSPLPGSALACAYLEPSARV